MTVSINDIRAALIDNYKGHDHDFTPAIDFYIKELSEKVEDYGNIYEVISDFFHGCSSGIVSSLIYYSDTIPFFQAHRAGIAELLNELQDDCGEPWTEILNGFDKSDMFCEYENNQNLLAWFLFEHINHEAEAIVDLMREED